MAQTAKRVFVSFPAEDKNYRDLLVGQMKNEDTPFEWYDYSVKEPWSSSWKTNCRSRIRGCNGLIGIVTKNTPKADGQLWEIQCAYDEKIPVLLVYATDDRPNVAALAGRRINIWSWENLRTFVRSL